jgi:hypothetical protein
MLGGEQREWLKEGLAGDRHFARIASFDIDRDGAPEMYEAMAGPIGAVPREPDTPFRAVRRRSSRRRRGGCGP